MDSIYISIIIPVFNVEAYLKECLDSVCNQTLYNIEIICVDDGSSDSSVKIMEAYAKKDSRIRTIYQKENSGTLNTRNVGVKNAKGEYILFLDADDYLEKDTCEILYDKVNESHADIIGFGANIINCDNLPIGRIKWLEKYLTPYVGTLYGKDILTACFRDSLFNTNLTMKLMRTELCKNAITLMPRIKACMAEDLLAFFMIAYFAKSFVGLDKANFYNYCYGRGLTGRAGIDINVFEKYCSQAFVCDSLKEFLTHQGTLEEYTETYQEIEKRLVNHCISSWRRLDFEERKNGLDILTTMWGADRVLYIFLEDSIVPSAKIEAAPNMNTENIYSQRDAVLKEFLNGKIGFKYIIKYFKAWFKYKIRR